MTDLKLLGQYYSEATPLRAAIITVPIIGSYLDLYLSAKGQKFAEERVNYLLENLSNEMKEIQEHLLNKEMVDSEEGYDLVQKAFIATARTRQKQKIAVFAKILRGAFTIKTKRHDPELYLKIVDELSEKELSIAFLLYDVKETKRIEIKGENEAKEGMMNDSFWFSKNYPDYTKEELDYTFPRIVKTGLIKELVGNYIGYGGGRYNATPLFADFISFISKNE